MTELQPGALETIRATPSVLRALLTDQPEVVMQTPGAEGWSPSDVVAHLVVAGRLGALARVRAALSEESPTFAGYDEEGELDASGLRGRPVGELIALLEAECAEHPVLANRLTEADLGRTGLHEEVGAAVSIVDLLHQAAYHDSLHIAQIGGLISATFAGHRGALAASSP